MCDSSEALYSSVTLQRLLQQCDSSEAFSIVFLQFFFSVSIQLLSIYSTQVIQYIFSTEYSYVCRCCLCGPAAGRTPWPTSPPTSAGSSSPRPSRIQRRTWASAPPSSSMAACASLAWSSSTSSCRRRGASPMRRRLSPLTVCGRLSSGWGWPGSRTA